MTAEPAATRLLGSLRENYTHAVIAFIDEDGYPLSVATGFEPVPDQGIVLLDGVAGDDVRPPEGREVNVVFSHIRPQPGQGYDERRYVSLWGTLRRTDGKLELRPARPVAGEQQSGFRKFRSELAERANQVLLPFVGREDRHGTKQRRILRDVPTCPRVRPRCSRW